MDSAADPTNLTAFRLRRANREIYSLGFFAAAMILGSGGLEVKLRPHFR